MTNWTDSIMATVAYRDASNVLFEMHEGDPRGLYSEYTTRGQYLEYVDEKLRRDFPDMPEQQRQFTGMIALHRVVTGDHKHFLELEKE